MTDKLKRLVLAAPIVLLPALFAAPVAAIDNTHDSELTDFSLEQLLDVEVTSVSKKKQRLDTTSSAIYVISQQDIKNAGVTTIPDALRLAPGIDVERIDSNKWAISSRGFNGRFSNKLLVLMDGRTLYSSSYSGVYWEFQDVILSNIERIEIIRGPGATVWGANAVNGVINIITKDSADTQGGEFSAGGGNSINRMASGRYGMKINDTTTARVNVKGTKYGEFEHPGGRGAKDDWSIFSSGMRVDHKDNNGNTIGVSADAYRGLVNQNITVALASTNTNQIIDDNIFASGYNLNFDWQKDAGDYGQYELRTYYDYNHLSQFITNYNVGTFDFDFTARKKFFKRHDLQAGVGYRRISDTFQSTRSVQFIPNSLVQNLYNAFVQDEIEVVDNKLFVTIGSKFEKTYYAGNATEPSIRFAYKPGFGTIWGAASYAVRTPARIERGSTLLSQAYPGFPPTHVNVVGDRGFDSERLLAYELGYRNDFRNVSLDVATFYNKYLDLRSFNQPSYFNGSVFNMDNVFSNGVNGITYGFEVAAKWQATDMSSFKLSYTHQESNINWHHSNEVTSDTPQPHNIVSLLNSNDITSTFNVSEWLSYQSTTYFMSVIDPDVTSTEPRWNANMSLSWRVKPSLTLQLIGQNLLQQRHLEYLQETYAGRTYVPRSYFAKATYEFKGM